MAKKFIKKAIKRPGRLRRHFGVKAGETIPKSKLRTLAGSSNKSLAAAARLAITLGKMRKS